MEEAGQVAIFWDYENCAAPSSMSGYELVKRIRDVAHEFGSIKLLKAYTELSEQSINSSRSIALRSELQSSGVSITDCPHNGYKEVADQMIIADMLTFAMDNPTNPGNTTILLISGDRDFSYALSVLRLRRYNVVVVAPSIVHPSLRAQASTFFEWNISILARDESYLSNAPQSVRGRPRTYDNLTASPNSTTAASLSMSQSTPSTLVGNQASCTPPSSSGSSSRSSKEYLKSPNSVASSTVLPSSAAPLRPSPCTTASSARSQQDFSCPPEIETNPPGYSAGGIDDQRDSNGSLYKQPPSSSTLDPSLPITSSTTGGLVSVLTLDETKVVAPKSVPILFPDLPPLPLRPNSAGPSFPETSYSTPQASLVTLLARRTTGRAPDALLPDAPSQPEPSPAPLSAYPQSEHFTMNRSTSITAKAENNVSSLSGGVMLSSIPFATSPGANLTMKASEPTSIALAATPVPPAPAPTCPPKSIPGFFLPLLQHLENLRLKGTLNPDRSVVAVALKKNDKKMYERAGCSRFKDFTAKAEGMGLIQLESKGGAAWIRIHPDLHGRIELKKA